MAAGTDPIVGTVLDADGLPVPVAVPDELVFASDQAAHDDRAEDPGTAFQVDGETFLCFRPKDSVVAMLAATAAPGASTAEQIHGVLTWFDACLEPSAQWKLRSRLVDRHDALELNDLTKVIEAMHKRWAATDGPAAAAAARYNNADQQAEAFAAWQAAQAPTNRAAGRAQKRATPKRPAAQLPPALAALAANTAPAGTTPTRKRVPGKAPARRAPTPF